MPARKGRSLRGEVNGAKAPQVQAARKSNKPDIDLDAAIDNGSRPMRRLRSPARDSACFHARPSSPPARRARLDCALHVMLSCAQARRL